MPRDLPIGNGNILIAFDKNYILREFFFPHVGEENHTKGEPFRFGVWANRRFSWLPEGWYIKKDYMNNTMVTSVELENEWLKIHISVNDLVDFHENIYVKRLTIKNLAHEEQDVRLFFAHDFYIYGHEIGDTAVFRPEVNAVVHYKGERYFLINACANNKCGIDQFSTGNKKQSGFEGTWRDAEDGILSRNPIAQGSVDSVVAIHLKLPPGGEDTCFYWICAGKDFGEVFLLNKIIWEKTPQLIFKRTKDYWEHWTDKEKLDYELIPPKIAWLYKRSLFITRTQIDNCGSIIAANDSDVMQFNRDTYSYMWPRDAALVAYALDLAGYSEITRRFFILCGKIIEKEGYFLHKYNPLGTLASSWHPWFKDKKLQLPIQEDETALVIWALWNHYKFYRDIEFIKPLYKPMIKNAADFMLSYRDKKTKLPLASYDLWEERQGIFTYTASTIYGGLMAASRFTDAFGELSISERYKKGAHEIRNAMEKYLYIPGKRCFARMITIKEDGSIDVDLTSDASLYGLFAYGVYQPDDEKVVNTMTQIYERLWCRTDVGGLARYENDSYYRVSDDVPGNPWFVTTLWLAQYYIAKAKTKYELDKALNIMEWVAERVLPSGVLAEQVNPYTDEPLSVSPLTWSHATFIIVVQEYINKLLLIERCPTCGKSKYWKEIPSFVTFDSDIRDI